MRFRVPLLLLGLFLLASVLQAGDLNKVVAEFKRNFAPGMNAYTREGAVEDLTALPDPAVRKTLTWAFTRTAAELRRLIVEKDEADEEVARLEKVLDDKIMRENEILARFE